MKTLFAILAFFVLPLTLFSQTPYTFTKEAGGTVILNGLISKYALQNYPSFPWYGSNRDNYTPDTSVANAFIQSRDKYHFLVFGGTWCEDTQVIIPRFFKLQEIGGIPDSRITFIGVDRAKQSLGNITSVLGVTNVPTIIVLKNGMETGRIIEYGKTGRWDHELAALLNNKAP